MNLNQHAAGTAQPGLAVQNIKTLPIPVPSFSEQQKIVAQIEIIENKIAGLEKVLAAIPAQKEEVLKKYL